MFIILLSSEICKTRAHFFVFLVNFFSYTLLSPRFVIKYTVKKLFSLGEIIHMDNTKKTVSFYTLGCRVNQYESDVISTTLEKNGVKIVPFGEKTDLALINTCTVTAESDRKSRQMIRKATLFAKKVVVAGCYSQISPEEASGIDGISYVIGNDGKHGLAETVLSLLNGVEFPINSVTPPTSPLSVQMKLEKPNRTRSYIKIEDGCPNRCSYCIINSARGPVRSKPKKLVVEEVCALAKLGNREVILTGIETASYGSEAGFSNEHRPYGYALADLISEISEIDGIERIGMGSLEPTVMTDYFVSSIAKRSSGKVLPHFHVSLQSGSNEILKRMRRRYTSEMAFSAIQRMKSALPEATFSADVIVGFPGETEENFLETVSFCEKIKFLHLHIFPYSIRRGTEAAEMPDQLPENVKKSRVARLEEVSARLKKELLEDYINKHRQKPIFLLVEKSDGDFVTGHSEHFAEIRAKILPDKRAPEIGEIVAVLLDSLDGSFCVGRIVNQNM